MKSVSRQEFEENVHYIEEIIRLLNDFDCIQLRALTQTVSLLREGLVRDTDHRIYDTYCGLCEHYYEFKGE